jgi:hypothetical protein
MTLRMLATYRPDHNNILSRKREQVVNVCLELVKGILCGVLKEAGAEDECRKVEELVDELRRTNDKCASPELLVTN